MDYSAAKKISSVYLTAFKKLFHQYNILTLICYIGEDNIDCEYNYIKFLSWNNLEQIIKAITQLEKNHEIIFINTFTETLIDFTQELKSSLWYAISDFPQVFRSKALQRELLSKSHSYLAIKSLKKSSTELQQEKHNLKINYPFVIKPSSWQQSSWVSIIHNLDDLEIYIDAISQLEINNIKRWLKNEVYVLEEYLDGKMFSIDYFVTEDWGYRASPPVYVWIWKDIGINDFMNYVRSLDNHHLQIIDNDKLDFFINWTIYALWLKNTFVHHEFKLTSSNELKTIEVNWRIGWYRLEMIDEACDVNFLEQVIDSSKSNMQVKNNFACFLFYPEYEWILKWFNHDVITDIKHLSSFYVIKLYDGFIGKMIWPTKLWYTKVAIVKIKHADISVFQRDIEFITRNYKNLLIM